MSYERVPGLRYLFIDFNAFFAAVEQHDEPDLFGRPVIVVPLASEHTMAIAASYEARRYGVKRGTGVREARQLCPGIAIRPARHDRYVEIHRQVMGEIETCLPLAKIYSIDEAAFRLSKSEAGEEAAHAIALKVRARLKTHVGPALRSSIGLAQTTLLAKLAAEMKKPDGLTILTPEDLPQKLLDLPLKEIPGVGNGVERRLNNNSIYDFQALWRLQPKHARKIWNSVQGERFWYALHGYEVLEPESKKSMIGHSRVLTRDYESPDQARIVARALLLKAASRLRNYKLYASRLSLSTRLRPDGGWAAESRVHPTQDSFAFLKMLDDLWGVFLREQKREGSVPRLGGVTVYLHGLCGRDDAAMRQGDLFAEPAMDKTSPVRARLWAAVDAINADPTGKYKRLAGNAHAPKRQVMLARQAGLDLNYLGAKIAFSRVPDESEFLF